MKEKLLVLCLLVVGSLGLTGCSSNEEADALQEKSIDNARENSNQTYGDYSNDAEFVSLMQQLEAINDSLAQGTEKQTRITINWTGVKNVIKADAIGAFKGFKSGWKDGGLKTAITRAAFQAMWYSIAAALNIQIKEMPSPSQPSMEKSYLAAYIDYHDGSYSDIWYAKTKLTAVGSNSSYLEIARLHNLACVNHITGVKSNMPLSDYLTNAEISTIQSEELIEDLQNLTSFLQNQGGTNPYQPNVQDKADMVMNAYLNSLDNNLYGSSIVSMSANSYIPNVLRNASLSADEKNRVISSICVACYSEVLWR